MIAHKGHHQSVWQPCRKARSWFNGGCDSQFSPSFHLFISSQILQHIETCKHHLDLLSFWPFGLVLKLGTPKSTASLSLLNNNMFSSFQGAILPSAPFFPGVPYLTSPRRSIGWRIIWIYASSWAGMLQVEPSMDGLKWLFATTLCAKKMPRGFLLQRFPSITSGR